MRLTIALLAEEGASAPDSQEPETDPPEGEAVEGEEESSPASPPGADSENTESTTGSEESSAEEEGQEDPEEQESEEEGPLIVKVPVAPWELETIRINRAIDGARERKMAMPAPKIDPPEET